MIVVNRQEDNWIYLKHQFKKTWIPDEQVSNCTKCKVPFSFICRRHHCRQCGMIFCHQCCNQRKMVVNPILSPTTMMEGSSSNRFLSIKRGRPFHRFNAALWPISFSAVTTAATATSVIVCQVCYDLDERVLHDFQYMKIVASYLSLRDLKSLMQTNQANYKIGLSYLDALTATRREGRTLLFADTFSSANDYVKINLELMGGHTTYLMDLLEIDPDYDLSKFTPFLPHHHRTASSCHNLYCCSCYHHLLDLSLQEEQQQQQQRQQQLVEYHHCSSRERYSKCRDVLNLEDYLIILLNLRMKVSSSSSSSLSARNIIFVCQQLSLLVSTEEELIAIGILLMEKGEFNEEIRRLIVDDFCRRSKLVFYQLYWFVKYKQQYQTIVNDMIVMQQQEEEESLSICLEVDKTMASSLFKGVNKKNLTFVTYIEPDQQKQEESNNNNDNNSNIPLLFNHQLSVINNNKERRSKPATTTFLLKPKCGLNDYIVNLIIHLMSYYVKKEVIHDLDLDSVKYHIYLLNENACAIQMVDDSYTLNEIKEKFKKELLQYIIHQNGDRVVNDVVTSFENGLAFYSIVTYLLGIGDRHLDNIMVHASGTLFHIDFEYILGADPKITGHEVRITNEMLQVLGGKEGSHHYESFKRKCIGIYHCLASKRRLIEALLYLTDCRRGQSTTSSSIVNSMMDHRIKVHTFLKSRFPPFLDQQSDYVVNQIIEKSFDGFKKHLLDGIHQFAKIISG